MEEFGWIILFFLFWVFSTVGDIRKRRGKGRREEREASRDRSSGTGPRAGERDLTTDVAEGARRAEEALRRWEARQRATEGEALGRSPEVELRHRLPDRRDVEIARSSMNMDNARARRELRAKRREAEELRRRADVAWRDAEAERKDAYEAIAGMLAGREIGDEAEIGRGAEIGSGRAASGTGSGRVTGRRRARATEAASGMPLARSTPMGGSGVGTSAAGRSKDAVGLGRLDRLPPLQRAIVLREVLGPPKALSPETDLP